MKESDISYFSSLNNHTMYLDSVSGLFIYFFPRLKSALNVYNVILFSDMEMSHSTERQDMSLKKDECSVETESSVI